MNYQILTYWCGPAAVQNALYWGWGVKVHQELLADCAQTTLARGTDEWGIRRAIRTVGFSSDEMAIPGPRKAFAELNRALAAAHPVILCVDRWTHWITVVGRLGDRYTVLDPERTSKNSHRNGSNSVHKRTLLKRWRMALREQAKNEKALYAIEVLR